MFKVLRQFVYSLLVVVFLVNIVSCDDAEMDNVEGIGVYALRNETNRKLYIKIDGDSVFIDTFATQVIKVHKMDDAPALPAIGLPAVLKFYYQDSTNVDKVAIQKKTIEFEWWAKDFDDLPFGHVQYLDTLEKSWL